VAGVSVRLVGLREFKGALRQVDSTMPAALKAGFTDIAENVAGAIRSKVPTRSGRAAGSVKARGSQRGGAIAFGGTAAPHYPWLDFGGSTHRSGGGVNRPFIGEGRYVYPTIRDKGDDIKRETDELVGRLAKKAGFTTTGGI